MNERERLEARWAAADARDRAIESGADPVDALAEYDEAVAELSTGMNDLIAWLRAQLDDDERLARTVSPSQDLRGLQVIATGVVIEPLLVVDSGHVLAEVEAKRRIIEQYLRAVERRKVHPDDIASAGALLALHGAIKALGLPYADRPGYRDEWRV